VKARWHHQRSGPTAVVKLRRSGAASDRGAARSRPTLSSHEPNQPRWSSLMRRHRLPALRAPARRYRRIVKVRDARTVAPSTSTAIRRPRPRSAGVRCSPCGRDSRIDGRRVSRFEDCGGGGRGGASPSSKFVARSDEQLRQRARDAQISTCHLVRRYRTDPRWGRPILQSDWPICRDPIGRTVDYADRVQLFRDALASKTATGDSDEMVRDLLDGGLALVAERGGRAHEEYARTDRARRRRAGKLLESAESVEE